MQVPARTDGNFPQTVARPSPLGTHTQYANTHTHLYILTLSSGVITYVSFSWHLQYTFFFHLNNLHPSRARRYPGGPWQLGSRQPCGPGFPAGGASDAGGSGWISWLGTLLSHMGVSINGGYPIAGWFFKGKIHENPIFQWMI